MRLEDTEQKWREKTKSNFQRKPYFVLVSCVNMGGQYNACNPAFENAYGCGFNQSVRYFECEDPD